MASTELPDMNGYWKLVKNDDNLEKYLQAVGLNFFIRKAIKAATVYQDIEQEGNRFKITTILPVDKFDVTFTVDEPFEAYNSFRKKTYHKKASWDGNVLVLVSTIDDGEPEERREIVDGGLVLTLTKTTDKESVTTKRYFEKIEKKK